MNANAFHLTPLLAFCLFPALLFSQSGLLIPYQGRLVENGYPVSDNLPRTFQFSIHSDSVGATNALWDDAYELTSHRGVFSVQLGSGTNPIPDSIFASISSRWLEVRVNGTEISRQRLSYVPYAVKSRIANALAAPDGDPKEAVYIDDDGNVGIGTHSPSSKLTVTGPAHFQGNQDSVGVVVDPSGRLGIGTTQPITRLDFAERSGISLRIKPNVSYSSFTYSGFEHNDLLIGSSGQVGSSAARHFLSFGHIESSPWKLSIGSASDNDFEKAEFWPHLTLNSIGDLELNGILTLNKGHLLLKDPALGDGGRALVHVMDSTIGNDKLVINYSGDFEAGVTVGSSLHVHGTITSDLGFNSPSDLRFKNSLKPLNGTLQKLGALRGVRYSYETKGFPNRHFPETDKIGVIAQEVEEIYPELVFTDKDGYKSVDYSRFAPILIEAVKEQQDVIAQQQAALTTSQNELAETRLQLMKLHDRIAAIESQLQQNQNH